MQAGSCRTARQHGMLQIGYRKRRGRTRLMDSTLPTVPLHRAVRSKGRALIVDTQLCAWG